MLKTILLLTLVLTNLYAMTNYIPENKGNTTYADQGNCELKSGQKCYSFDSAQDLEVMLVKDGKLKKDANLKAAKEAKLANEIAEKEAKATKIEAAKALLKSKKGKTNDPVIEALIDILE